MKLFKRIKYYRNGIVNSYLNGQLQAYNNVLNYLNTYDDVMIDKHKLYKIILEMEIKRI
jgi:hypothetical protein